MNMNEFPRFLSGVESSLPRMVASPSEENWVRFHMDLQSAQFIVPLDNAEHKPLFIGSKKIRTMYIPIFTSEVEYLKKPFEGTHTGVIPYITLRYVIALYPEIGGLVINPFGMQMLLRREQILVMSSVTMDIHKDRLH